MSRNEEKYHNKGEQDYAEKKGYDRPHGTLAETINTFPESGSAADARAENEAYNKGYNNAKEQDKQNK